jgi:hypothetical protein
MVEYDEIAYSMNIVSLFLVIYGASCVEQISQGIENVREKKQRRTLKLKIIIFLSIFGGCSTKYEKLAHALCYPMLNRSLNRQKLWI